MKAVNNEEIVVIIAPMATDFLTDKELPTVKITNAGKEENCLQFVKDIMFYLGIHY